MTNIKSGMINGKEFSGYVLSNEGTYIGSVIEVGGSGFAEHFTSPQFTSFQETKAFVLETWTEIGGE